MSCHVMHEVSLQRPVQMSLLACGLHLGIFMRCFGLGEVPAEWSSCCRVFLL
jgi:hypothetical protein